jgi:saccharopine dehydrogenase-like NADP-dependent oxidoreductase
MAENKKILVLGSGMVAPPCIEYLMRSPNNAVTIGKKPHQLLPKEENRFREG